MIGMVVNLTALHDGNFLVQKLGERPHQAALGLALFAEKNNIVVGQKSVGQLGNHGFLKAVNMGKQVFARL